MGFSKQESRALRQVVSTEDRHITGTLDASTTTETVFLNIVAEKVTAQSTGTLAGTVEFSSNGTDYHSSTAFAANTPVTYSTHLVVSIKVTWTSGTGRLSLVSK